VCEYTYALKDIHVSEKHQTKLKNRGTRMCDSKNTHKCINEIIINIQPLERKKNAFSNSLVEIIKSIEYMI
jgi:hypothetical protein